MTSLPFMCKREAIEPRKLSLVVLMTKKLIFGALDALLRSSLQVPFYFNATQ